MAGHRSSSRGTGRRGGMPTTRRYPRAARINEVLRQVLAEEIERLVDHDERLNLLTVTAVETDPDYRTAKVLFSSLGEEAAEALADARVRLQATVARQVRLKWTPLLSFAADPAIAGAQRVEDILRSLDLPSGETASGETASGETASGETASGETASGEGDPPG
jgi:ribosome-binding factor A